MKKIHKITLNTLAKIVTNGFNSVNHQLVQLNGEAAFNRGEIEKLHSEMNQGFRNVDKRFNEINKRFDINDDTHQEILQAIDEMTDQKITTHCKKYHSVVI